MATGKPKIALLSLEKESWLDEMHASLFTALRTKAYVTGITTEEAANELFAASAKPDIIFATDAALTDPELSAQRDTAIAYVRKDGGTLIFGGVFPSFAQWPDIDAMFQAFGLPWESGAYTRTELIVNDSNDSITNKSGLTKQTTQKALLLKNVGSQDAVYLPDAESHVQGQQTPAVLGTCGAGRVGYVGCVNAEKDVEAVIMAMCGL